MSTPVVLSLVFVPDSVPLNVPPSALQVPTSDVSSNVMSNTAPNVPSLVVAWLLVENRLVPPDAVIDARTLPEVRMPARDKFVDDDRTGGKEFR